MRRNQLLLKAFLSLDLSILTIHSRMTGNKWSLITFELHVIVTLLRRCGYACLEFIEYGKMS